MTEEELQKQADEILHTFNGKQYDGSELMVVIGYVLTRLLIPIIEQNSVAGALDWLTSLTKVVMTMIRPAQPAK